MRLGPVTVLLLLGCGGRSVSTVPPPATQMPAHASEEARHATQPPEVQGLASLPSTASLNPSIRVAKMPPAVPTASGGVRIDLRGVARHVRTLERQPDGTYRQACRGAAEGPGGQGAK
jgi:hypothetical protein